MGTSFIQANSNGRLHPAAEPSVSPLNRGFLYGDAVYEVWRTYEGVIFAWEEHWERLEASAAALFMKLPLTAPRALEEIRRTVTSFQTTTGHRGELYIRLQITRGGGPIGLDTALAEGADFVVLVQENRLLPPEKSERGLSLRWAENIRRNPRETLNPAWKTGNYLNNVLALREARARGADEVVITNLAGEITEAAVSNIGFVRGGKIITPALSCGLLAGVTRRLVLSEVAPRAGISASEEVLLLRDLASVEECFLLSTTKDVTPVAAIDDVRFAIGRGTATSRLKAAFGEFAHGYAERRRGELGV
ncbi:aminotransferase class IV [Horticoccus luteus]|uniref:branched-chain-amino-acid transaminase n=1 Tax=Horticoccus luteus TaxID=2862869 RepID=A0A8F9TYV4_9BACT|nr:aminotransferase class IV [Horticoccus luteus]QYM80389.1 aminotransferase class IV [Horticoccus luteus]